MTYRTIHTAYGLQRIGAAEATGTPINLTHMAVGDGNGNAVMLSEEQTQLVREVFRATVNRVYQDPTDTTKFTAELVIPANEGGFTLREAGIFDDAGGLFAVANLPDTYKPQGDGSEGSYADTVLRMEFIVTSANIVTLQVDPNVAVATQAWILNTINAGSLFPGGLTGQVLTKDSNADGDASWHDPTDVNVVVSTIEEEQTLSADQTEVILAKTNTIGLAVYIEGVRLPIDDTSTNPDAWWPHPTDQTRAMLGKAYPAGSKIIAVQNEPASRLELALQQNLNLSDLQDKAVSRTNLGVYSKDESDRLAPVSEVAYFARQTAPTGWLKANGAAISRTAYASLFAAIGTTFGAGDGFNTFNLPDLRGEFIRGWDDNRGVDTGRTLGSSQTDQNQAHTHTGSTNTAGSHTHTYVDTDTVVVSGSLQAGSGWAIQDRQSTRNTSSAGSHTHTLTIDNSGGTEARPRNVALLACIKF